MRHDAGTELGRREGGRAKDMPVIDVDQEHEDEKAAEKFTKKIDVQLLCFSAKNDKSWQ